MRTRLRNQRGTALLETAITLPIILFISVAIFEFGRAYQVQQVLTNAAREGARIAVLEGVTDSAVSGRVMKYLSDGKVINCDQNGANCQGAVPTITVERAVAFGSATASRVTIVFPYSFMVLNPVARLVVRNSNAGAPVTMKALAMMRNE